MTDGRDPETSAKPMKNMLGCGGMRKLCACPAKATENSSVSSECTSSSAADVADEGCTVSGTLRDCEKQKKKSLLSIFSPRNIFRGLKREMKSDNAMLKVERTIKAAILIQQWYRSYLARMEIRRRYTWTIFQSIEYQGEQSQVKVYDFFNALLTHMPVCPAGQGVDHEAVSKTSSLDISDKFEDESSDTSILENIDGGYKGPHIDTPITLTNFHELIDAFRKRRDHRLHARYVAGILREATNELRKLPNFNQASTAISKQITVCGDLHGKLDDLLVIFYKNGLPSAENPYVFNGDFVDRGKKSLEILLLLLSCLLLFPGGIFLNRGNHEDHVMNQRYGFVKEMKSKYKHNSEKLLRLIDSVYRWLPLGTIIDKKVLVVHGGISDITDLDWIKNIDRHRYVSLLRPPISENSMAGTEVVDKQEWKQVFDILWSDPQGHNGCVPNSLRGAGTYFGPDVTKRFLQKYNLSYLIRSHECKPWGYEVTHDDKVITIFSASNYYETGSNKGAYLKLTGPDLSPHFVQFTTANNRMKSMTFRQRVGLIESSALKELSQKIVSVRDQLTKEFESCCEDGSGTITVSEWCSAMEKCTGLSIPWRMLREKLVATDPVTNRVISSTTFHDHVPGPQNSQATVVETLYRNKSSLEAIFRIIDKDNSGYITLDEFSDACDLLSKHMPDPIPREQLLDICRSMDINKDGLVDLNEFLETFRLVDIHRDPSDERDDLSPEDATSKE